MGKMLPAAAASLDSSSRAVPACPALRQSRTSQRTRAHTHSHTPEPLPACLRAAPDPSERSDPLCPEPVLRGAKTAGQSTRSACSSSRLSLSDARSLGHGARLRLQRRGLSARYRTAQRVGSVFHFTPGLRSRVLRPRGSMQDQSVPDAAFGSRHGQGCSPGRKKGVRGDRTEGDASEDEEDASASSRGRPWSGREANAPAAPKTERRRSSVESRLAVMLRSIDASRSASSGVVSPLLPEACSWASKQGSGETSDGKSPRE
eukprot:942175-Rhodomonas_salina.5